MMNKHRLLVGVLAFSGFWLISDFLPEER